ncbi:MAG TPA: helix-turn-helix domain-containing protein [Leptospiraceae bacterium]|nr:helix-turn-helix domain-containing protein [Leptospiraceae bacterium]
MRIGKTQEQAAKLLGISRGSLQYKIKNNPNIQNLID